MALLLIYVNNKQNMKTIRTNCFETNSSSTHSFTIHKANDISKLIPSQTFIPGPNGDIDIMMAGAPDGDDSSIKNKLRFLLYYTVVIGNVEKHKQIIDVVETFTNAKLNILTREYDRALNASVVVPMVVKPIKDGEGFNAALEDEFCSWVGEYGNGSVDDFKECANSWIESSDSIKAFIFSDVQPFSSEAHYDG